MYHIEQKINDEWVKIPFAEDSKRAYCEGFVDARDSQYPCKPLRIILTKEGKQKVVRETKGRGEVHLN
jgi:hypothetical protein